MDEIDKEIDSLPQEKVDRLIDGANKDRRCKIEIALMSAGLFLLVCAAIFHISFYIGDHRPPLLHRFYLLVMTAVVMPYAFIQFYKAAYNYLLIHAARRIYVRDKDLLSGP